jgi:biopolymer transport protein ExbD
MGIPKREEEAAEPNVLPVMNIMFLMIPALLLAMEIAKMAAITVSPPQRAVSAEQKPIEDPPEKPLDFKVLIQDDGFRISTAGEPDPTGPIPLAKPNAPMTDYERYDYAALEAKAREIKQGAKHETVVEFSAENHIPLQVLTSAMDAVRGSDCKALTVKDGEPLPEECLFIQPIIAG